MYKYFCLNPISPVGLEKFSDDYVPAGEMAGADAVLVRSAGMHELEFDKDLKAIARAGAGVNNIPLDKCVRWRSVSCTTGRCGGGADIFFV